MAKYRFGKSKGISNFERNFKFTKISSKGGEFRQFRSMSISNFDMGLR